METVTAAGIEVAEGRLGRGVFATRAFAAQETIEVCPTLEVADSDVSGRLGDYVFNSADDEEVVILLLGYGMLYNHSSEANAEYVEHGPQQIAFVALHAIEAGDEITIDYGAEWWDTRDAEPD
jgi:SET domain-containing protein